MSGQNVDIIRYNGCSYTLEGWLSMTFIRQAAKEEIGKQQKKKGGQPREGIARCTFDDRIQMSDIVFFQAALPFVS